MRILIRIRFYSWAGPEIKFYNIFNFKSLIRESTRIEPPSAIFLWRGGRSAWKSGKPEKVMDFFES